MRAIAIGGAAGSSVTTRTDRFLFVDTSAFYARLDRSDQWHQRAVAGFTELARRSAVLVTSNLVVVETHQLTSQRLGFQAARDWLALLVDFNVRFQTSEEHQRVEQILRSSIGPHSLMSMQRPSWRWRQCRFRLSFPSTATSRLRGSRCFPTRPHRSAARSRPMISSIADNGTRPPATGQLPYAAR